MSNAEKHGAGSSGAIVLKHTVRKRGAPLSIDFNPGGRSVHMSKEIVHG